MNNKNIIISTLLTFSLTACNTISVPDNVDVESLSLGSNSMFWQIPENKAACSRASYIIPLKTQKNIEGWGENRTSMKFLFGLGQNVSILMGPGDHDPQKFIKYLLEAANSDGYTILDFDKNWDTSRTLIPSPVFTASLLMISLSYAVSYLDQSDSWMSGQREIIVAWGNKILKTQGSKKGSGLNGWMDSRAAIVAARMAWGATTSQPKVFNKGLNEFHRLAGKMSEEGQLWKKKTLRNNNEVIQHMIVAAEAATKNGINAYDFSYDGLTLHDAVEWHAIKSLENINTVYIDTVTRKPDKYVRPFGYVAHIAWAPIYLSRFPDHPASSYLNKIISKFGNEPFEGVSMGGNTGCLWGISYS